MQQFVLELSDEEMEVFQKVAANRGQSREEFLRSYIREMDERSAEEPSDSLEDDASAFDSKMTVNDTVASNPGGMEVEWTRFFRAYPRIPIGYGMATGALIYLAFFSSLWWWLALLPMLGSLHLILSRIQVQFRAGDTNPGIILSQQPPLVAVLSDLSMGSGDYPIIKIVKQPLRACGLGGAAPLTRVVTVALYSMPADDKAHHWSDFDPVIVQAATRLNEVHLERLNSISVEQWEQLETALAGLPQHVPGVYPLDWEPRKGTLLAPASDHIEGKQG